MKEQMKYNVTTDHVLLKVPQYESVYDIIQRSHYQANHNGNGRTLCGKLCKEHWWGLSQKVCELFISVCPICSVAAISKVKAKQQPLKMILTEFIGQRAQMDLIDMTYCSDGIYNWVLRLSDHLSGYQYVRATISKQAEHCARAIVQILSSAPPYRILQCDNGGEFWGETVKLVNK